MSLLSIDKLVSFGDLTDHDLDLILDSAEKMAKAVGFGEYERASAAQPLDRVLGVAFYEPSTRTRLSFESAMLRLGGGVLGFSEANSSSVSKGESLVDTARTMAGYCDILVMRHPKSGAAKVAAEAIDIPFINAGDGTREHPTQTLTDLFCIRRELGTLSGLKVGLCGDLKFGRTVHSLAPVMAHHGSEIVCIAPEQLTMPERYLDAVEEISGVRPVETDSLEDAIGELDVLYMTRIQAERFECKDDYLACKGVYVLTPAIMQNAKESMRVLHPMPRVDEIDAAVDSDPRAAYFRQSAGGVPVRMALMGLLMGLPQFGPERRKPMGLGVAPRKADSETGVIAPVAKAETVSGPGPCRNGRCITSVENIAPAYFEQSDGRLICAYCENEYTPER